MSVNKVILVGNLGRDPEVRVTTTGKTIVNMSVATSESWLDPSTGERKEKTEWHRIVIYDDHLCQIAQKWLMKGSKVYLEGRIETRKWTGNDGQDKYTTEIILPRFGSVLQMLDNRGGGETQSNTEATANQPTLNAGGGDLDDEIPF